MDIAKMLALVKMQNAARQRPNIKNELLQMFDR